MNVIKSEPGAPRRGLNRRYGRIPHPHRFLNQSEDGNVGAFR
jgi:hypothetical protein